MRPRRGTCRFHRLGSRPRRPSATCWREWKAAGRASKDVDDALWQRFKAAQDTFFSARNAVSPGATPSSAPTPKPRRRCWRRPRGSTPPTWTPRAPPCAPSATSGTRSARCPASAAPSSERRLRAVEKKVRDAPSHGVDPEAQARADQFRERAEQFERQAEKAAAAGRTKDAEEARASAAAVAAVGGGRRRGARQEALGPLRSVAVAVVVVVEALEQSPWSGVWPPPCVAPPRRRVAARCAPTPPAPSCTSAR